MSDYNANEIRAKIIRKKILQLVAENYILSASLISHTLLLSYATVLRHLRILNEEGYVELYKEGRTLYAKIRENSKQIQILNSESTQFKNSLNNTILTKNVVKTKDNT
ncbi:transcriptional regulator [Sulfolobus spindle-shaped virus 4]|uniref:Putative HTH-5 transcription regulator n=1 Tax=Sulfolobus spindle-shaped virus 4 TaxID=459290 RepID=A8TKF7_9VIRU|nr:transcriptional regulator [Sulfolobus spindle-shaped virus 4]ABV26191.1 putative HTH-5 transcription regulator [Sulfolobus spindle-shaped virus 4]